MLGQMSKKRYQVSTNFNRSTVLIFPKEHTFKDTLLNIPRENVSMPGPEQFLFNADQGHHLDAWIPNSAQLEACWLTYLADIDPLVRILHKPSTRKIIDKAQQTGLRTIDAASLTIVLAVCFSAVASLDSVQCAFRFGEDGKSLLERCKISVQNAFTQARLVESHDIQVLQAFVLFIVSIYFTFWGWLLTILDLHASRWLSNNVDLDRSCHTNCNLSWHSS
jgi:hypothetical protein